MIRALNIPARQPLAVIVGKPSKVIRSGNRRANRVGSGPISGAGVASPCWTLKTPLAVPVVSTHLKTPDPAICAYMRQQWPIGRWPWYLDGVKLGVGRDNRQGAPAYRVKNRRKPPKNHEKRAAAHAVAGASMGHVSLKYSYEKRYRMFHVKHCLFIRQI